MPHVGSERMEEVRRGLGPSRMGEQISEIDQQQQCNSISQRMVSLKELIWRAKGSRTLDTTQNCSCSVNDSIVCAPTGSQVMVDWGLWTRLLSSSNMTWLVWICLNLSVLTMQSLMQELGSMQMPLFRSAFRFCTKKDWILCLTQAEFTSRPK